MSGAVVPYFPRRWPIPKLNHCWWYYLTAVLLILDEGLRGQYLTNTAFTAVPIPNVHDGPVQCSKHYHLVYIHGSNLISRERLKYLKLIAKNYQIYIYASIQFIGTFFEQFTSHKQIIVTRFKRSLRAL